ncbi:hypothetical protein B0T25DRAFT_44730 [Lasiosphaeria hispida]|uniref:Secreted protein n=1 Tax=Lasiosphaeria hispida TaxID=260671 RepID=A0AAJ0HV75_9PEZI|nr:hypothetical protein B0T25DRAFT_44730 [Lasiosphaeria hispida]
MSALSASFLLLRYLFSYRLLNVLHMRFTGRRHSIKRSEGAHEDHFRRTAIRSSSQPNKYSQDCLPSPQKAERRGVRRWATNASLRRLADGIQ